MCCSQDIRVPNGDQFDWTVMRLLLQLIRSIAERYQCIIVCEVLDAKLRNLPDAARIPDAMVSISHIRSAVVSNRDHVVPPTYHLSDVTILVSCGVDTRTTGATAGVKAQKDRIVAHIHINHEHNCSSTVHARGCAWVLISSYYRTWDSSHQNHLKITLTCEWILIPSPLYSNWLSGLREKLTVIPQISSFQVKSTVQSVIRILTLLVSIFTFFLILDRFDIFSLSIIAEVFDSYWDRTTSQVQAIVSKRAWHHSRDRPTASTATDGDATTIHETNWLCWQVLPRYLRRGQWRSSTKRRPTVHGCSCGYCSRCSRCRGCYTRQTLCTAGRPGAGRPSLP